MNKLNINRTGMAVGSFVGLVHLVWVLLLGLGLAEGRLKFFLGMHFLSVPVQVTTFSWMGGLVLVVLSVIGGYIMGSVFSFIWNKVAVK